MKKKFIHFLKLLPWSVAGGLIGYGIMGRPMNTGNAVIGMLATSAIVAFACTLFDNDKKDTPQPPPLPEEPMTVVDETNTDIDAISRLINNFPQSLIAAISSGDLSLQVEWVEVTRDEDDWPTIKPRVTISPNLLPEESTDD